MENFLTTTGSNLIGLLEWILKASRRFPLPIDKICQTVSRLESSRRRPLIESALKQLVDQGQALCFSDAAQTEYFHCENLERIRQRIIEKLTSYHRAFPQEEGMSRSEVRKGISDDKDRNLQRIIDHRILELVLSRAIKDESIVLVNEKYRLKDFHPICGKTAASEFHDSELRRKLFNLFNNRNPGVNSLERLESRLTMKKKEIIESIGQMLKKGEIIKLDKNRYMSKKVIDSIKSDLVLLLGKSPGLYITEIADSLSMSRKSISPVLDYLDETDFTVREGDYRRLADPSMTSNTGSRLKSNSYSSLVARAILIILLALPLNACNPAKTSDSNAQLSNTSMTPLAAAATPSTTAQRSSVNAVSASAVNGDSPCITFETLSHDFGKIIAGDKAHTAFTFRNTGKTDLIIEKVKAGCGCTAALASSQRISPDGTGQIDIEFNTTGRKGKHSKNVSVMTNDPVNPVIQLTFSADIFVLVGFEPQRISFGKFSWKQMEQKTLKIVGEKANSVKLVSVSIVDPDHQSFYLIDYKKAGDKIGDAGQITIQPTSKTPLGRFTDTLRIRTDIEEVPIIDIPVFGECLGEQEPVTRQTSSVGR